MSKAAVLNQAATARANRARKAQAKVNKIDVNGVELTKNQIEKMLDKWYERDPKGFDAAYDEVRGGKRGSVSGTKLLAVKSKRTITRWFNEMTRARKSKIALENAAIGLR